MDELERQLNLNRQKLGKGCPFFFFLWRSNVCLRIKSFDDTDTIKLQNMLRWSRDTHDAILWLREHKHLFKMEVMEPPYMCMTVPDKRYQDAVESLINSAQLRVSSET